MKVGIVGCGLIGHKRAAAITGDNKLVALCDVDLKKAIKMKLLGVFLAICTAGIIAVGYLFNAFQDLIL